MPKTSRGQACAYGVLQVRRRNALPLRGKFEDWSSAAKWTPTWSTQSKFFRLDQAEASQLSAPASSSRKDAYG